MSGTSRSIGTRAVAPGAIAGSPQSCWKVIQAGHMANTLAWTAKTWNSGTETVTIKTFHT